MRLITVIDVCRELRVEPTSALTWPVGDAVRGAFEERFGRPPVKALRQKTKGGGSHCFAVYPETFRGVIRAIILSHQAEKARQPDLFDFMEAAE
jgi:hypothetical protein